MVTGDGASWVLIVDLDEEAGALTVDEALRDEGAAHPGIDFNRMQCPQGETGDAIARGALFGR